MITIDRYCTRKIKMRIAIAKEAFNRTLSFLISKLNIEHRKKLVRCIALCGSETWTLRTLERDLNANSELPRPDDRRNLDNQQDLQKISTN